MASKKVRTFLTVDLGGTSIRSAGVAGDRLLGRVQHGTPAREGPQAVTEAIVAAVRETLAALPIDVPSPSVLGVAAPGPLNAASGVVHSPPNLYGWHDVPLASLLEDRLLLPVRLIKDANAAALAEHRLGAGRGTRTMIYVTLSTGIGGGLILDGNIFHGIDGVAGEVGHVTVDAYGPVCNCGNVGCIEEVASGTAIARQAAARIASGRMLPPGGVREPTAAQVVEAAQAGDAEAAGLVQAAGRAIGLAFVGLTHLFNPEAIVIGGGLLHAGPLLLDPLRAALQTHTMEAPRRRVRLVEAALGDDVGLWGAALWGGISHGYID